ncbi:MAG: flagellar hook assembly protein FlgD [Endomicrobiales bacterium]
MMKRTLLAFLLTASLAVVVRAAPQFKSGTQPLVDGVYNSTQVVITSRSPVFSWEFASLVSSFTVTVSSDEVFSSSGELWNYAGTTTTANTINYITRIKYDLDGNAALLGTGDTCHWQVTLFEAGESVSAQAQFSTVSSAVTLPGDKLDLAVDWNNPFDPSRAQVTRFRFSAKDRDRRVQLRIFTLSGELVRDWPEQTALQNAWYAETWDGKNDRGETVARGIYFVNLKDVGETVSVTRRVAVVKESR